jgi:uncharacterized RDD family membrane protein YckC
MLFGLSSTMEQEPAPNEKPTLRPPDLSGPPDLSPPVSSQPPTLRPPDLSGPSLRPPDLSGPTLRPPDLTPPPPSVLPPPSIPAPSMPEPTPPPPSASPSLAPPTIPIPEEAQKKPKIVEPDPDEVQAGDLASFNSRVVAGLIDFVIAVGLNLTAMWILPHVLGQLGLLLGAAYLATRDSLPFLDGQSIGKKAMKLKALKLDDTPLTGDWKTGLIRNIPLLIPLFGLVEVIILLTREEKPDRGRRLGDEWAKTKVIFLGEPVAPPEL